jgi:nitrogen fixation/metabolism regulation signal transduction histidine kinase
MVKVFFNRITFRLSLLSALTAAGTYFALQGGWLGLGIVSVCWLYTFYLTQELYTRNARKVAFMFDAIDNVDYTFRFATEGKFSDDKLVNTSLNRIIKILFQAKAEAIQKEKYYELIMNSITTGIIVIGENGYIYQTNNEALRLLGLTVFTHVKQVKRVDANLEKLLIQIKPGEKQQTSFYNERGSVRLSVRVSEMTLQDKHVRIIAINDINSELDDKEIDSWIRLTRVLTHEIMNAVTPITSLSEMLLSVHGDANKEIRSGLEIISTTGQGLLSFVESYRKFTHIPTPRPNLFYVKEFTERMVRLTGHLNQCPNIRITIDVTPENLILYADENLISQVVLNLLKNAVQAIGKDQSDGHVEVKGYCNEEETVFIEVSNNGPAIPPEEVEHIFIPFFTTKEGGSGVGLSISRQIMRLSGGSITLKSIPSIRQTSFLLTFP